MRITVDPGKFQAMTNRQNPLRLVEVFEDQYHEVPFHDTGPRVRRGDFIDGSKPKERIMSPSFRENRSLYLMVGLLGGLCLASFWPQETLQAVATDRDDRFAITTVDVGYAQPEAVFVLDFLTGRLTGGLLNQQSANFTNFYFRNIAADFQIDAEAATKAKYVMIPGRSEIPSGRGTTMAVGTIYIAEMTSGKVVAYSFPFKTSRQPLPPVQIEPFAFFPFREAAMEN